MKINGSFMSLCGPRYGFTEPYEKGLNKADTSQIIEVGWTNKKYKSGFHFFINKKDADYFKDNMERLLKNDELQNDVFRGEYVIIECLIKKSWVIAIGIDDTDTNRASTVVVKKAIFPI